MHPYLSPPRPHLFAHRGASGEAPENTLPAFERAVQTGVPFLEMDCHATRDGEIVICHDADLDRMTDASGPVRERTWAELARIDAGWGFTPDGGESWPFRGKGVRIPRLVEVLDAFRDVRINLEVKQGDPAIAARVLDLVREAGASERVLLAAEHDDIMAEIRALDPPTATGSSLGDAVAFFRAIQAGQIDDFRPAGDALQIPSHFGADPLITEQSVAAARHVGLAIHVWTINDRDEMRSLLAAGVDGVMSDFPGRLVEEASRERAGA